MDFEKAYQNFINGTASPEEVEFVRSEMKKASDVNNILANVKNEGATDTAEKETVKKAIKTYRKKDVIKTLLIVAASLLVVAIGIACAIGIPILVNAKDNVNYSKAEAEAIAIEHVADLPGSNADKIKVREYEKELEVEGRLKKSHYVHVFEIYDGASRVWEVEIDSRTGDIIDIDD